MFIEVFWFEVFKDVCLEIWKMLMIGQMLYVCVDVSDYVMNEEFVIELIWVS